MDLSLIITTYNWKEALRRCIFSAIHQTLQPKEIIVADDGSEPETGEMIRKLKAGAPMPIIHSWHKDKGFRAALARNKAIAQATSDYIILVDQDMLLAHHFCEDHANAARPGFFIQGSRVLVDEALTKKLLAEKGPHPRFFDSGIQNRKNCLRSPILSRIFSGRSRNLKGIRTCNFSFWRNDAITVNGFNNSFVGWGREDSEFAARLLNSGIKRYNLRFRATAFHLHHPQLKKDELACNNATLGYTVANKLTWCDNGLDKYLDDTLPRGEK